MAKKVKKEKKVEPKKAVYNVQDMIKSLQDQVDYLFKENNKINDRIDRIVTAISKARSVKGL